MEPFPLDLAFVGEDPSNITRGMTFHIRLELGDISEAILLPKGGFFASTGGNWIYILDESGSTATKTKIRVGRPRNFGYGTVAVKGGHLYSVDEDEEGFFSIAIYSVIDDR